MSDPGSAHHLLSQALEKHIETVRDTSRRILVSGSAKRGLERAAEADAEAIHDFRVALRRLRTALRPGRRVYGRKKMRALSQALKRFAEATSALRDEEVLRETLTSIDVREVVQPALLAWLAKRARQERARRTAVARLLRGEQNTSAGGEKSATLKACLATLEKRLTRPKRGVSALELGERAIERAREDIRALGPVDPDDTSAMHTLRILFKRLRYTAELFEPALADPEAAKDTARTASRLQTTFGELHDLDQAALCVARARGLPAEARSAVLSALRAARARKAERCLEELASSARAWMPADTGAEAGVQDSPRQLPRIG